MYVFHSFAKFTIYWTKKLKNLVITQSFVNFSFLNISNGSLIKKTQNCEGNYETEIFEAYKGDGQPISSIQTFRIFVNRINSF